ncbi:hypothetical protein G6F22_022061 [Rhizopus arrhizus]|nr:hypothetical protein G6F22_022061 [Rhizopus arrhizus]
MAGCRVGLRQRGADCPDQWHDVAGDVAVPSHASAAGPTDHRGGDGHPCVAVCRPRGRAALDGGDLRP